MTSLADALPPEIVAQIHPDWRANEAAYWSARERLLPQYQGQWIGFADGVVIASGTSPVAVFHALSPITAYRRRDELSLIEREAFWLLAEARNDVVAMMFTVGPIVSTK